MSKPTAWLLPLEPFESRYTGEWYREFPRAFRLKYATVNMIDGEPLSSSIDVGSWLPMNSTVHYKNTQVAKVAKAFQDGLVKDGDVFFSFDLEHWGIEAIRMMAQVNNIDVKIYAFLHAASYTREDLMEQLEPWQKYTELGWLSICDKVFVGSEYHKRAVIDRRIKPLAANDVEVSTLSSKIIATGNPLFKHAYTRIDTFKRTWGMDKMVDDADTGLQIGEQPLQFESIKQKKIILPNRFDFEKRPNLSLDIAYILKKKHPDWEFVVTTSNAELKSNQSWLLEKARAFEADGIITIKEGLTKEQYHRELAESAAMLTNSIEENFGYCIAEALYYDCMPVAPVGLSHDELVPEQIRFNSINEACEKIELVMSGMVRFAKGQSYIEKYFGAADRIVTETLPPQKKSKGLLDA